MKGIENVNVPCTNNVLALAFKKSGIKVKRTKIGWPRVPKGKPLASRIDRKTGKEEYGIESNREDALRHGWSIRKDFGNSLPVVQDCKA